MASLKATFTLDEETVARLRELSSRTERTKSEVVREAILDYSERRERLSDRERLQLLRSFDELVPKIPERPAPEVEAELKAVRAARRSSGRGSPDPDLG